MNYTDEKTNWLQRLKKGTITQEQYDKILDDIEKRENEYEVKILETTGCNCDENTLCVKCSPFPII